MLSSQIERWTNLVIKVEDIGKLVQDLAMFCTKCWEWCRWGGIFDGVNEMANGLDGFFFA